MGLNKLIDWYIHPTLKGSTLVYSRAYTIVSTGIIAACAAPFYALFYYFLGCSKCAIICLLIGTSIWIALGILKKWGYINLSREFITTSLYLGVLALSYTQGGLLTPSGFWLILPPILGVFLGGIRPGVWWLIIITITITSLFALELLKTPQPLPSQINLSLLMAISIDGLACVILALVYYFENAKIQGFYQLQQAAKMIEEKSFALLNTNHELKILATQTKAILTAAADGIITVKGQGRIDTYNRAIMELFGYNNEELTYQNLQVLFTPPPSLDEKSQNEKSTFSLKKILQAKNVLHELVGFRKDGSSFPLELTLSKVKSEQIIYICVIRDITERKKTEESLAYLAHYDVLTNLPNRTSFDLLLNQAVIRAKRSGKFFALLYLDLDYFKNVNDTLGHDFGDLLLKAVASRINKNLRKGDIFARLGGDEFAVILEDIEDVRHIKHIIQNFIKALKPSFNLNGYEIYTSASIGVAIYPTNGLDSTTLTKHADMAMYQAKDRGRRNYEFFSQELNSLNVSRIALENHLHHALRLNELVIFYQLQTEPKSGYIIGIEALLRWKNASLGAISPEIFIPIAEKIGLITSLGEWVLEKACKQFSEWQSANLLPGDTKIALNISSVQLKQQNFVMFIKQILNNYHILPKNVELEITETAIMQDQANAVIVLNQLNQMGVSIAIDDFGTGYSSLSQLKCLPVHTLKIDKSFINDLAVDKSDALIIKAIIALGHGLELKVLAEGVETKTQLDYLLQNNCDYVQGFYFSRPLSAEDMTDFLRNHSKA